MQSIIYLIIAATLLLVPAPDLSARPLAPAQQKTLYTAQQAQKAGRPERATKILQAHIKRYRSPASEIYLALGNLLQNTGKPTQAENVYRQGLNVHPQASSLLINLALILADTRRFTEAGQLFVQAASVTQNSDLQYQGAAAFFQGGAYPKALSLLRTLVETSASPRKEWLQLLIHVCMETEDFKLAERTLHHFLKRNPTEKPYWKLLSRIHLEQKKYPRAASALEIALTLPGAEQREWRELGGLYLWIDAPMEAAACYEKGMGEHPEPEWLDRLAQCYALAGRSDMACDALDRAITIAPTRERFLQKVRVRYRSGDYTRCRADARTYVQKWGGDEEAHYLAGICAVETGKWKEAAVSFTAAMQDKRFRESAKGYIEILEQWSE